MLKWVKMYVYFTVSWQEEEGTGNEKFLKPSTMAKLLKQIILRSPDLKGHSNFCKGTKLYPLSGIELVPAGLVVIGS
jgi:hypothetical protein